MSRAAATSLVAAFAAAFAHGAPPAAAQSDADTIDAETAVAPEAGPAWSEAAVGTFFTGPDMTELRPEDEIRTGWLDLPAEVQEEVRRDCSAIATDAQDMQGAASGGVLDAEAPVAPGAESTEPPAEEAAATAEACALVANF